MPQRGTTSDSTPLMRRVRYSDSLDLLLSSIVYLGTHGYHWARSPRSMARELSLDEERLLRVLEGFPGIFRRGVRMSEFGQHFYALQARYAQRTGGDTEDPEQVSYIAPLDKDRLQLLIGFVVQQADEERSSRRAFLTNGIAAGAAAISAATAVLVASLKADKSPSSPPSTRP